MPSECVTLAQFVEEERQHRAGSRGGLDALILDVALACAMISRRVASGGLTGVLGNAGAVNVQGEQQQKLDVLANDIFLRSTESGGRLAGVVSEELDGPYRIPRQFPRGRYLLTVDPLDGSSNIDVNVAVGSIFSVWCAPVPGDDAEAEDFLRPGTQQVAAGYAIYGPSTILVLTVGAGVHGFTLDPEVGEFVLSHRDIRLPGTTAEFAVNCANRRFWEPPVERYIGECVAGISGPRAKDFNMRWVASLVAEAHRILIRGGVFLYPKDTKNPAVVGRLRLLYEANPIAFLIEQAGGLATTGTERILEVTPTDLHQRIGLIFGCREEVERITRYHTEVTRDLEVLGNPLYGRRGLFRATG